MAKCILKFQCIFLVAVLIFAIEKIQAVEEAALKISPRQTVEYKAEGLKDPFAGYFKEEEAAQAVVAEQAKKEPQRQLEPEKPLPSLVVQGIIWGGNLQQAIINGKVVKVGDVIEGIRIVDIRKNSVTIFFNNKRYILYIVRPSNSGSAQKAAQRR